MNRKIKFRAYNPEIKKMFYDFDQSIKEVGLGQSIHLYVYETGLCFDSLMQFTGLKDRNGREVYEGDILSTLHFIDRNNPHYLYHKVVYSNQYFSYNVVNLKNTDELLTTHGNTFLYVLAKNDEFEVIGNIYENPELL